MLWTQVGLFGYILYRFAGLFLSLADGRQRRRLAFHLVRTGAEAVPLILVLGFFTGSVLAWQAGYQFRGYASMSLLGGQSSKVIFMEIGPIFAALVMAGRIGSSMAAEIASMRTNEQLDALYILGIDPHRFIVFPRILSGMMMLPILTIIANLMALMGASLVGNWFLGVTYPTFWDSVQTFYHLPDITGGIIKAVIYGILVTSIGCHVGLNASRGALGVGDAAIRAFVWSAIAILIGDYFLWLILF
jgi:phospholipid/cholesterol/gamma-HCH transport system permease protein